MEQEKSKSALPVMAAPYEPSPNSGIRPQMLFPNWFAPLTWLGQASWYAYPECIR